MKFSFFEIKRVGHIWLIYILNEQNMSAQRWEFYTDLISLVKYIESTDEVNIVIFTGKGDHFSAGLDIKNFIKQFKNIIYNIHEKQKLYNIIKTMQNGMQAMFNGNKIYIAAISGYCIGSGLDFISACDLRFCSFDAIFSLKEAKLGITADLGSLQRLPFIIGFDNTKFLAFSADNFNSEAAKRMGLVSEIFDNKEQLIEQTLKIAERMLDNPKTALLNSKKFINSLIRDRIDSELDSIAKFNAEILDFEEIEKNYLISLKKR